MRASECQLHSLPRISEGNLEIILPSLHKRLKLTLKRRLGHDVKRALKKFSNRAIAWLSKIRSGNKATTPLAIPATRFGVGDVVRVRSKEAIQATLNYWKELKGCGFMEEMVQYCGTTQKVLKPVQRFLDERDYQMKRCRGIVLLEGVICHGTADYGQCDRACLFFWREEWLEKIDEHEAK